MSARPHGSLGARLLVAVLANAMTWIAIHSWNGIVERPLEFTGPALTAALLITSTGALLRGLRLAPVLVLAVQVLVVGVWFFHHQQVSDYAGGWVPTPDGIAAIADQIRTGASAINTYLAPVRAARVTAPMYLLALALLLMLAVDFVAAGLRRPTWAGLPVLIALTVPISVLDDGLLTPVFIGTAVCFVMLLAAVENEHVQAWGQAVTAGRPRGIDALLVGTSAQRPALRIGLVATTAALLVPAFLPIGENVFDKGPGSGSGAGNSEQVTLKNPMADLRRDLVRQDPLLLLEAQTDSSDPTYLRTTVLDTFTGRAWIPGKRKLPATNRAGGPVPNPAGFVPSTDGETFEWSLRTTPAFSTSWLPAPYVTRNIEVSDGDWRYDRRTLDLVATDDDPPTAVSYSIRGVSPVYDAVRLAGAPSPPRDIAETMTRVPQLSPIVARIARDVTAGATTDYDKVVALQEWFRREGGFRYSLSPGPGDGMAQLERFVTTERVGYCEQFAAAMAVMTRALDIPARVVVGFLEPSEGEDGRYLYTSDDLHAWPEAYFSGSGWVRFEPTPSARTGTAPAWTRSEIRSPTSAPPSASPTTAPTPAAPADKPRETQETATSTNSSSRVWLVLVLAASGLGLLAVPTLLRRSQRRRRLARQDDERDEVENWWRELRATAVDHRVPWPDGRSPRTAARLVCHRVGAGPDETAELQHLVGVLEEARYREQFSLDDDTRARCQSTVATWIEVLGGASRSRRLSPARLFPLSTVTRTGGPATSVPAPDRNSLTEVG